MSKPVDSLLPASLRQLSTTNPAFIQKLLGRFETHTREELARLMQSAETTNRLDLRRISHRLKSSARAIGLDDWGLACERLEKNAEIGEISALLSQTEAVVKDGHAILENLPTLYLGYYVREAT